MFERVGSIRLVEPTRAEFDAAVTESELVQIAGRRAVRTLQCSRPVKDSVWQLLNESFFRLRPDVELRVYGHYSTECDLSFARRMTAVRRFAADCLLTARHVEAISEIPLDSLALGIFELRDLSVLNVVSPALRRLRVGATVSTTLCLGVLGRFTSLKALSLEGQSYGIEVVGELRALEQLTMSSIVSADLGCLAPLTRLWSLDIKLGSIRSFEGLAGKATLKYLQLWHIRELEDADVVASLPGLQHLFLQSLKRVRRVPSLRMCPALRRVVFQNMKGLDDFTACREAPALEELAVVDGTRQQPEQLVPVLRNPMVSRVKALLGTDRKDRAFVRLREAHGKSDWDPSTPFAYR